MNRTLYLVLAALLGLAACSTERTSLFPSYRLKIVQGNELDPRAAVSLQSGMTRSQVILLLGAPLLCDPFHVDRWDYAFSASRNGVIREQIDLILYFENGLLVYAEGNAVQKAIEAMQAEQKFVSDGQVTAPLK